MAVDSEVLMASVTTIRNSSVNFSAYLRFKIESTDPYLHPDFEITTIRCIHLIHTSYLLNVLMETPSCS